jgi:glycosyltransferase involved in cell wall biosynthesis
MTESAGQSHRAEHFSLLKSNRYAATVVMNILDGLMQIESVLDLGCGLGTWLEVCLSTKHGRQVLGVELEEFPTNDLRVEPWRILNASLAEPINLHRRFDLVLCLETAEHLAPGAASSLVKTCTGHSDVILFSAALPGQGGLHHVNEQLPEYWANLFQERGFEAIDLLRPLIWNDRQVPVWYRQNMLLFVRRGSAAMDKLADATCRPPLGRAHPDLLDMVARRATQLELAIDTAEKASSEKAEILNRELVKIRTDAQIRIEQETAKSNALASQLHDIRKRTADLPRKVAELQWALDAERRHSSAERSQKTRSDSENRNLQAQLQALRDQTASLLRDVRATNVALTVMRASTSWRVSAPVRWIGGALANPRRTAARHALMELRVPNEPVDTGLACLAERALTGPENNPELPDRTGKDRRRTKIVFISGEPETPGHYYRVLHMARSLPLPLFETIICDMGSPETALAHLDAKIFWFWRVPWSETYENIVTAARRSGSSVFYDIDDLMFRPELARVDIIDGIRTQKFDEAEIEALYVRVRKALCLADLCVTTTETLAREIHQVSGGPVCVVQNGFSGDALQWAEAARNVADAERSDGLIRIGYAAGTLTHQRDFQTAAAALAALLTELPHVRLVLFKGTIDLSEFPELEGLEGQIEWRERVPLDGLLYEYARFDINIVPLEVGNDFCEAKSELKFFEAALVGVPTVASPTSTFYGAIKDGVTGFLAHTESEWHRLVRRLCEASELRKKVGEQARNVVIWRYGPERRTLALRRLSDGINTDKPVQTATSLARLQDELETGSPVPVPDYKAIFERGQRGKSRISVIIPMYNYMHFVIDALESVLAQTERDLDLIVVDDCSSDDSLEVATRWLEAHCDSFNHVALLKNAVNSKLGATRNAGIHFARTELYLPLDADNVLRPSCIERLRKEIDETGAALAYPRIESFGDTDGQVWHISSGEWDPDRLRFGNYIDAMALVRTACWSAVGGYVPYLYGWEDYDFWCSFVEHGFFGAEVPDVLADYRYHQMQMIKVLTANNEERVHAAITARHPWLRLGGARKPDIDTCDTLDEVLAK